LRGQRFFCSNRGRRGGCGCTFCVWLATVIARASVRTAGLWRFLTARLDGASVLEAWAPAGSGFSLEGAERWWRRWQRGSGAVRTRLWRGREPPGGIAAAVRQTYGSLDPIAGFQRSEQVDWPAFTS